MITQQELKELIDYNSETGVFTWKVSTRKVKVGEVAGCLNYCGYNQIRINKKLYYTHRLAWFYVYNTWPQGQIDHINGIKTDNRIENLRVVTNRQNSQNRKTHREGKLVGSTYNKQHKKWVSNIRINNKQIHLGLFETEQQAREAYLNKLKELKNE